MKVSHDSVRPFSSFSTQPLLSLITDDTSSELINVVFEFV